MGKRKDKRRKSSDDSLKDEWVGKRERRANSEDDESVDLSGVLKDANSVLYGGECNGDLNPLESLLEAETERDENVNRGPNKGNMADNVNKGNGGNIQPSNADIMKCLTSLHKRLDTMNEIFSTQNKKLDQVNEKISGFEVDLKKLWSHLNDMEKKSDVRLGRVEERVESSDFLLTVMTDKVAGMEKREGELVNEIVYLQSQSMRNNLILSRIPESTGTSIEDTENIIRDFLVQKMKLAQDLVDSIKFDRVHRMGQRREGISRNIVARFTLFKEREMVRRNSSILKGSGHFVFEQFPKEVNDRRKQLLPRLKEEQRKGNKAWLSYDTLFINGRPVKDVRDR